MQQQVNATELKHFQSEMVSSKSQVVADPEFHFAGNKKQYYLKKEELEKQLTVLTMDDSKDCTKKNPVKQKNQR